MNSLNLRAMHSDWTPCATLAHGSLTLVALAGTSNRFEEYLLASEAIAAEQLTITEISETGSVPELQAINHGLQPILLIAGEELRGAKQNRVLNTSILLAAQSTTRIPVSCVEQGRWSHVSHSFQSGLMAPPSLRQRKAASVHRHLRETGQARSDQGDVWDSVDEQIRQSRARSATQSMGDAMEAIAPDIERYRKALACPPQACGVIALINGHLAGVDLFDAPSTLAAMWERLVASHATDARRVRRRKPRDIEPLVTCLLEQLNEADCERFATTGRGDELRFETADLQGHALQVDQHLLHVSAFARPAAPAMRRQTGPTPPQDEPGRE